ncbi:MAG: glycoside hydrolase family 3 [Bacteroidetes bacterium]|nr:glycoside hydrolase family 3 [Bacteroidota bacterium]
MKHLKLLFGLLVLLVAAVWAPAQPTKQQWVQSTLKSMSLREQIAQLFVIACHPQQSEEHINKVLETIKNEHLGGIIWGLCSPTRYLNLLNQMQEHANIPLLVTMDAEWGVAMRLDSVVNFPRQLTMGAIQDNQLIYDFGAEVARQCRLLGVHINFAPVVDVNINPNNPVISMRSFGENKYKVTEKGYACMKGMLDGGLLTCLKHFPGHGDTDKDSHEELPAILHNKQRLNDVELYPFRELIKRGATGVMTAHLLVPALSKDHMPASQSKKISTDLLQKKLKFKGLVITDGLEMRGAIRDGDPNKVALNALLAGNDLLEIPPDIPKSIDEIVKAVQNGKVSKRFIQKKCKKILETKYDLGLYRGFSPIDPSGIIEKLNTVEAKSLRLQLAATSLTLLSNQNVLPLADSDLNYLEIGQGSAFKEQLFRHASINAFQISPSATQEQLDSLSALLPNTGTVVVGYHNVPRGRSYVNFTIDEPMLNFLEELNSRHPVVLLFFANPYALANFKDLGRFAAVVACYDNSDEAQISAAKAITGAQKFLGKLPVTINPQYKENFGLITP